MFFLPYSISFLTSAIVRRKRVITMTGKTIEIGEAKLTSKGQITIPAAVRAELGLSTGDRVSFVRERDGGVRVTARKRRSIIEFARQNPLPRLSPAFEDRDIDTAVAEALVDHEKRVSRHKVR
jgi:antitoxin PrlF